MGWVTLTLRKTELQQKINDAQLQKIKLNTQLQQLTSFANAVGSGSITPANVASFGTALFGDALDYMTASDEAAAEVAQEQTDYYCSTYGDLTANQYATSGLASQATLYYDEDGNLDEEAIYANFYKQNLKEYGAEFKDVLNEKEKEIQNELNQISVLLQSYEAEEQSLDSSIQSSIQNSAIKFS